MARLIHMQHYSMELVKTVSHRKHPVSHNKLVSLFYQKDKFNKKYNVNIVAIKSNNGGKVNISPEPEYKFKDTDIVVLVGDIESINRLESI